MVNMSKTSLPHQPFPSWPTPTSRSSVFSPLLQPTHQSISPLVQTQAAAAAEGMEMLTTAIRAPAARNNTPGPNCLTPCLLLGTVCSHQSSHQRTHRPAFLRNAPQAPEQAGSLLATKRDAETL